MQSEIRLKFDRLYESNKEAKAPKVCRHTDM